MGRGCQCRGAKGLAERLGPAHTLAMTRLIGLLLLLVSMALAAPTARSAESYWSAAQLSELDQLFSDLAEAPDEAFARDKAERIWRIWTEPADAGIAEKMQAILQAGLPSQQLPLAEALVRDHPDYSEGWNLRATLRFLTGDNEGALADIVEALKREPRHFGALAGRVLIYHQEGKSALARAALDEALKVHPFLPERALFPELRV